MVLGLLLVASLAVTVSGLRHRVWWMLALAAAFSILPGFVGFVPYAALLLLPLSQLAMAVALRWNLRFIGWCGLLLIAVVAWFVGAALPILTRVDVPAYRVVDAALLAGIVALAWGRPRRLTSHQGQSRPAAPGSV